MADEIPSSASELEPPASPTTDDQQTPAPELETASGEEESTAPELEEIEWEGQKYKVPPSATAALREQLGQMSKHFTTTSQSNAAKAKELETRESRVAEQAKASEDEMSARLNLRHIDSELKRFENFGWTQYQTLRQTDPAAAEEAWAYKQHLISERAGAEGKLSAAEQARNDLAQKEYETRIADTEKFAREKIKGWTPEVNKQVMDFAAAKGFSPGFLSRNMSPQLYETFHLARLAEEILRNRSAPKPPPPPPAPLETVQSKTPANDPRPRDSDDIDTWMRKRQKQREKGHF